jgi:TRAP-type mannitol/chloroaromatic compound transport system substrate-binding protein
MGHPCEACGYCPIVSCFVTLSKKDEGPMKRREFIKAAGLGTGAVALAKPAIAQSMPELKWRLTSSFPKSLDTIYGAAEIVPGLAAADAVQRGIVEMCHTASYYYFGKDPTFAFGTAVPFGLNSRMQNAWLMSAGGNELLNDFYKKYSIYAIPAGNTGAQMGGWFAKEINDVSDLDGLKMRIGGFAGIVLQSLGAFPQQITGGDIYAALDSGKIDAAEWVGPYDDEKLGFHKVAKYYYYPGWWEGSATLHNFINLDKWESLPPAYKSLFKSASALANEWMLTRYDAENPAALKRLVASGALVRPFSQPVLDACFKAANQIYADTSATNPEFKKVYERLAEFRGDEYLWWQVAEHTFNTFQINALGRG